MKNKIAIASAFVAASSFSTAEIVVNDFLSFEGFIDMSYVHGDAEFGTASDNNNSFAIDQVEIDWLFDFDVVTGQIDLEYEDNGEDSGTDDDLVEVEQAFATYHFDNGGAITAGRFASMLGFEAFEPTGLYQYSFSYDIHDLGLTGVGASDLTIIPGYAQGVKFTYETDTSFFGIALQDEVFDDDNDRLGGSDDSSYGIEIAGSLNLGNGLTWFLGGAYEDAESATPAEDGGNYVVNTYLTFETGAWVFAGEVNFGESETGAFAFDYENEEVLQALLMANFAYSDEASVTGRLSFIDHEGDLVGEEADFLKYTLAHGYAFTDNLLLVTEVSYVDGEISGDDFESLIGAVELIFSF